MAADHLSLYQLTIEDGTAFGARHAAGGLKGLPDEDLSADMYLKTQETMSGIGLPAYEVSNHARPGSESRHNLIYWRCGDYAGIGPGAHGRLTLSGARLATSTPLLPNDWLTRIEVIGSGELAREAVPRDEQANEYLMMGLRLTEGLDVERYAQLAGHVLQESSVVRLEDLGLVAREGERLRATEAGRPVLNAIIRELSP